jgi:hypothetical protein
LFGIPSLLLLLPFVAPIVGAMSNRDTDEGNVGLRDWMEMGGWREYAAFLGTMPLTILNLLAFVQDVTQFFGSGVAFVRNRGSFPDPESHEQSVSYRLPVGGPGPWSTGARSRTTPTRGSRFP